MVFGEAEAECLKVMNTTIMIIMILVRKLQSICSLICTHLSSRAISGLQAKFEATVSTNASAVETSRYIHGVPVVGYL